MIPAADMSLLQVFCGNPTCWSTVTYMVESLPDTFKSHCPVCGKTYPKEVLAAIQHYVLFFENAVKIKPAQMNLRVEL
ncbi:MAG: hypothetical protein ACWGQW_14630 [bacterium]